MIKNLTETTIFQSWNSRLVDEVGFDVPLASFKELFRPIIFSLANFLSKVGGADITTSAVTISNTDGVFLCALLVNRTVDQENKTSFDVSFTTDKELVNNSELCQYTIAASERELQEFVNKFIMAEVKNRFQAPELLYDFLRVLFSTILNYTNSLTRDEITEEGLEIDIEDTITIAVSLDEESNRVVAIEPGTALKTYVKDDKFNEAE